MTFNNLTCISLTVLLSGCSLFRPVEQPQCPLVEPTVCPLLEQPEVKDEPKPKQCPKPQIKTVYIQPEPVKGLPILGYIEWVDLLIDEGLRFKARIDTGAKTTSMHAEDLKPFERDGERWLQFTIPNGRDGKPVVVKKPIKRMVRIKQHKTENDRRYVVEMRLAIGDIEQKVEATINDRSKFIYPILIGRNFLDGKAIVDVSRKYVTLEQTQ